MRNRTQEELTAGVTFDKAREIEEEFFEREAWLHGLRDQGRCGVEALKQKLSELLVDKLRPMTEDIQQQCRHLLSEASS